VTLTAVGQPVQFGTLRTPPAMTGAGGHFLFHSLGGGSYSLSAFAPGYLGSGYGQRSPLGPTQPFVLEERQRVGGVVLRLWRGGEIGGVVTDETGASMPGLNVLITRRVVTSGRAELRSASVSVRTDDRGAYSHANLQPGEYVVAVPASMTVARFGQSGMDQPDDLALVASGAPTIIRGSLLSRSGAQTGDVIVLPGGLNTLAGQLPFELQPDGRLSTYATTFHPSSTTLKEATVVKLGVAEERRDVNLQLRPVVTARVNGTLVAPDGPAAGYAVHLIPAFAVHTPLERFFEAAVAITDRSGGFTFPAVAAGSYVIQSWRMPSRNTSLIAELPAEPSLWAEASLSVDAAPVTVALTLRRGAGLRGRIVLEGTSPRPMPRAFQATLGAWFEPPWPLAYNAGPLGQTRISDNWEFMREGVPPGTYVPHIPSNFRPPAGWYFKSATLDGRDLLRSPLVLDSADVSGIVVTFTDRRTTLSGTVVDRSGRPDSDAAVFVFPADYQTWLQHGLPGALAHTAAVTQTGSYEFRHVPPGEYLIAAASLDQLENWLEESVVRTLAVQATRVTLTSGSVTRQDLRR
jgi:protocatechuate 3,4-dioxygenase beta subunit